MELKCIITALCAALPLLGTATASAGDSGRVVPLMQISAWQPHKPVTRNHVIFEQVMLRSHNLVRARAGVAPLDWDAGLAHQAERYARQLASEDRFQHSPRQVRGDAGENLWMGTRSAFSYAEMTGSWAEEGAAFQPGRFPRVSRTGDWSDVGHYTQMIWAGSKRMGCAIASNDSNEFVVCRYWPAGNVVGRNPLDY